MKKIPFQEECSQKILNLIEKNIQYCADFNIPSFEKPIILEGPTGMGKTAIMAKLIDPIEKMMKKKVHFIFLSLGQGGLSEQSESKFKNWLGIGHNFIDIDNMNISSFSQNSISFINWEKIHSLGRGGKRVNNLLKETEHRPALQSIFENTRMKGIETILIIDESHLRSKTDVALFIKESLIQPSLVIEVSATPTLISPEFHIKVDEEDVINAGLIKKGHFLNVIDLGTNEILSVEKLLLNSFLKREEMEEAYHKINSNIIPLLGVQVPNGKEGDTYIKMIEDFFESKGISYENGKLSCWLDNNKKNLKNIEKSNGIQRVLIFKQAIAQGWDCPRAGVWLKLRDSSNTVFNRQTCGRFGRMPEHRHYNNELLDNVHIFTNDINYTIPVDQKKNFLNYYPEENSINNFSLNIPSIGLKRTGFNDITEEYFVHFFNLFVSSFKNKIKPFDYEGNYKILSKKLDLSSEVAIGKTFLNEKISTKDLKNLHHRVNSSFGANIEINDSLLTHEFEKSIEQSLIGLSGKRSSSKIESIFLSLLNDFYKKNISYKEMYSVVINNKSFFSELISQVRELDLIKPNGYKKEVFQWNIPSNIRMNKETHVLFSSPFTKKYPYKNCYIQLKSSHEEVFIETINSKDFLNNIKLIFKNGEGNKHSLGICSYIDPKDNRERIFYIDWIIESIDGTFFVLEIKDKDDENYLQTKAKAEALQKKLKQLRASGIPIYGGIVFRNKGCWLVDDNPIYDYHHKNSGKLLNLESFLMGKKYAKAN